MVREISTVSWPRHGLIPAATDAESDAPAAAT